MFIDALETILRAEGAGGFWRVQDFKHVASNEAKTWVVLQFSVPIDQV